MKKLNTLKFVVAASERMAEYRTDIRNASTYEEAKRIGERALGYIDALITFENAMLDKENNDFTDELGTVIGDWYRGIYQAAADVADRTGQDTEVIMRLLDKRDSYKDNADEDAA